MIAFFGSFLADVGASVKPEASLVPKNTSEVSRLPWN